VLFFFSILGFEFKALSLLELFVSLNYQIVEQFVMKQQIIHMGYRQRERKEEGSWKLDLRSNNRMVPAEH
jgi:hypothetical protein